MFLFDAQLRVYLCHLFKYADWHLGLGLPRIISDALNIEYCRAWVLHGYCRAWVLHEYCRAWVLHEYCRAWVLHE